MGVGTVRLASLKVVSSRGEATFEPLSPDLTA